VTQTQQEAQPQQALHQCESMANLLWLTAPVCLHMHRGPNVETTRIHRMLPQQPLVAVPLFVLEESLSTEQEMPTPAVTLA
jgi:hypothetical protein